MLVSIFSRCIFLSVQVDKIQVNNINLKQCCIVRLINYDFILYMFVIVSYFFVLSIVKIFFYKMI